MIACSVSRESERAGDMVFCGRRKTDEGRSDRKKWSVAKDASLGKSRNMRLWQRQNLSIGQCKRRVQTAFGNLIKREIMSILSDKYNGDTVRFK